MCIISSKRKASAIIDHNIQCSFAFLESYVSSAYALSKRECRPNYGLLLNTTILAALAMCWGYWSLRQVPFVREWCEGDNWFSPVVRNNSPAGVEEHHCALTCDIIVTGAIAVYVAILSASTSLSLSKANDALQDPSGAKLGLQIAFLINI
jgi:hypothetical protein